MEHDMTEHKHDHKNQKKERGGSSEANSLKKIFFFLEERGLKE